MKCRRCKVAYYCNQACFSADKTRHMTKECGTECKCPDSCGPDRDYGHDLARCSVMKHEGVAPWAKPSKNSPVLPVGTPPGEDIHIWEKICEELYEKQCRESKEKYLISRYWHIVENQDHIDVCILQEPEGEVVN